MLRSGGGGREHFQWEKSGKPSLRRWLLPSGFEEEARFGHSDVYSFLWLFIPRAVWVASHTW